MGLVTVVLCLIFLFGFLLHQLVRALRPSILTKGTTNVPGPPSRRWPIIGDALWLLGVKDVKSMWMAFQTISGFRPKIISFYLFSKLMIWVYDAEMLEKIAKKCPDKEEEFYGPLSEVGNGIVTTTDNKRWSLLRQSFNNNLRKTNMDDFMGLFEDKAKITCEKVQRKCGQGVFDIMEMIQYFTLDITLEVFLGYPGTQQLGDTMNLVPLMQRYISYIFMRLLNPLLKIGWLYKLSSAGRGVEKFKADVTPKLQMLVDHSMKKMSARGSDPTDPNFEPNNYLEALIHVGLQQKMSHEEILFAVVDIIIAGFDTTGTTITSAILFLAMHPEYQEEAYQEQLRVMGDSLRAPTRDELSNMKFLDMVFSETLRKVGVPAIVRVLEAETKIDDYVLPEGASIYVMFNILGSDPRYWEKPSLFYPNHFSPENVEKRPKCAFMPFSFGKRGCPGKTFGLIYAKLLFSMLLRRFKFTTPLKYDELTYKYMIMVEFEFGYPVEATPRISTPSL
uniref:Cytochrome P450 4c21 n=2 Tax=Lygus hesperus TaxID=30085 RepID=A0A0A9WXH4_LYGHE